MAAPKPTIVLVPGAWHSPSHYIDLINFLQKAGYPTKCSRLPSVGSADPRNESTEKDANFIREKLLSPLLDEERDIILVMHSYGGCPGAAAAKGLSKSERGSKSGIVYLVFITAFLAREGDSLKSALGGRFDPGVSSIEVFYHDVPQAKAAQAIQDLLPQSENALASPSPASAWVDVAYDGRRAYIIATEDRAIPPIAQKMMLKHSGVEWTVSEFSTSHSPFLSQPESLADAILGIAEASQNLPK